MTLEEISDLVNDLSFWATILQLIKTLNGAFGMDREYGEEPKAIGYPPVESFPVCFPLALNRQGVFQFP